MVASVIIGKWKHKVMSRNAEKSELTTGENSTATLESSLTVS